MQKELSPKATVTARVTDREFSVLRVIDHLDEVESTLSALYMMGADLENQTHISSVRHVVTIAEQSLALAKGALENNASRLRVVAKELRAGERKSADAVDYAEGCIDPLLSAIADLHRGEEIFNATDMDDWSAMGGERAVVAKTFGPPLDILANWQKPATTRASAMEALRLAHAENLIHADSRVSKAMVMAALAFFEQEAV